MIKISSEAELLSSFRNIDRDQVQLPAQIKFPLAVKDYYSWTESSGHRLYVVFEDSLSKNPMGIMFQRTHASSETPASMCQWCHKVRSGSQVALLTASAHPDRRIGIHLCADLNCRDNVLAPPGVNDFPESLSNQERIQRILHRMSDFARRHLF